MKTKKYKLRTMTNFIIENINFLTFIVVTIFGINLLLAFIKAKTETKRNKKELDEEKLKLKHLGIDESHPYFHIYRRMLYSDPEFTYYCKESEHDLKLSLRQAFENKELFYDHYVISKINEARTGRPFSVTFTKID